jgi:pSer/pThr/pTyr-binding forkhead associated (FHA) protein
VAAAAPVAASVVTVAPVVETMPAVPVVEAVPMVPVAPVVTPGPEALPVSGGTGTAPGNIAVPAMAPTGIARLELVDGGVVINLPDKDDILIGREDPLSEPPIFPDIDMTPYGGEEGGVSRRHARIMRRENDYLVEDLQSTNYTKLNGQRLAPRTPSILVDGSRVDFGKIGVIFRR